jgi:hypothetical protein
MLKINEMYGVGRAKYVVNYFTGKKHQDGSDFYDIRIFKNEKFKCSYRYSFTQGVLNLQYRYTLNDNIPLCMSLYGDYTRVDN